MNELQDTTAQMIKWCKTRALPLLKQQRPQKAAEFEKDLADLERVRSSVNEELSVCFLGSSGVGKSTLINALVAGREMVVPSGGIGPLTAQALMVCYHEDPCFEVEYHPVNNLWQLIFALEQTHKARLRAGELAVSESGEAGEIEPIDAEDAAEIAGALTDQDSSAGRAEHYRKTAQLLVSGGQDNPKELTYLIDRLREAADKPARFGTIADPEDSRRMDGLRGAMELARQDQGRVFDRKADEKVFRQAIKDHASGFLAPLIRDLKVHWPGELLRQGVRLVDLPGIGIAGDVYREVTRRWIREKAQAVVLVVDRAGITNDIAELLRNNDFLNRLLYSADDPTENPVLLVSVVHIDDVAETRWAEEKASGTLQRRSRSEHFADVCREMDPFIRNQLRSELGKVMQGSNGLVGEMQQKVIENLLNTLQVHPVSAVQYRKFLEGDEDDKSFLNEQQSNIPRMAAAVGKLATSKRAAREQRLKELADIFVARARTTLKLIQAQWQQDSRAKEESERLRGDMENFLRPLREELRTRQGQYREFLKETVPQQIENMVSRAAGQARKEILAYLRKLDDAHWNTLKAAVMKGGTFFGARHIDLPRDFGLRFEEPIAEVWSKDVLSKIRYRTKQFSDDCVELVERVVVWAKQQGTRVQPQLIEAQRDAIKADAKKLEVVGRECVNELRDQVKDKLIRQIEAPIRKKCKSFVERNQHQGRGVTLRILSLFNQLAEDVCEVACEPSTKILTQLFGKVEREITAVFELHQDPLQSAADAIVSSQEAFVERSDRQRRKKVLAEIEEVLEICPIAIADEDAPELLEASAT